MKKELCGLFVAVLLAAGCASVEKQEVIQSDAELIDIKLKQLLAISETSLEVSKRAEDLAQESFEKSNQAEATSVKALEAVNETRKFTEQEVNKAIDAANAAKKFAETESQKAVDAAKEASQTAIAHADKSAEKSIAASNEAIAASNKSIAAANQNMAEVNRLRATIRMQEEVEPILKDEPVVTSIKKSYTVKQGDTLSGIAYYHYKDTGKWRAIYNANRNIIKNPDVIVPGTRIVIP